MSVSSDTWPLPPTRLPAPASGEPLRRPPSPGEGLVETDGELLRLFRRQGDTAALDRLVQRHAPMVWRVCRHALRRQQDAEDAFQATFLLLVKSAHQIGASESAAGWLYRVAYRTSIRARKRLAARREESLALDPTAPSEEAFPDLAARQVAGVLAEELIQLPARYQTPLVMRYLEGQSRRAIAEATDVTVATVQGRLARGKQLLRRRLVQRGVTMAAAVGALAAKPQAADAVAPAHVVLQTTSNATALATGGSLAASAAVVTLLQQGTRAMLFASMTKPLAMTAACGLAAMALLANADESAPSTTVVSTGVVLDATVAEIETEATMGSAALQLAAKPDTANSKEGELEASAPGVAAANNLRFASEQDRTQSLSPDKAIWAQRLSRLPGFDRRLDGAADAEGESITPEQNEARIRERWRQVVKNDREQDYGAPSWEEQEARYEAAKERYNHLEKLLSYKLQQRSDNQKNLAPEQWIEIEIEVDGLMADHAAAKAEALRYERELKRRAAETSDPKHALGARSEAFDGDYSLPGRITPPSVGQEYREAQAQIQRAQAKLVDVQHDLDVVDEEAPLAPKPPPAANLTAPVPPPAPSKPTLNITAPRLVLSPPPAPKPPAPAFTTGSQPSQEEAQQQLASAQRQLAEAQAQLEAMQATTAALEAELRSAAGGNAPRNNSLRELQSAQAAPAARQTDSPSPFRAGEIVLEEQIAAVERAKSRLASDLPNSQSAVQQMLPKLNEMQAEMQSQLRLMRSKDGFGPAGEGLSGAPPAAISQSQPQAVKPKKTTEKDNLDLLFEKVTQYVERLESHVEATDQQIDRAAEHEALGAQELLRDAAQSSLHKALELTDKRENADYRYLRMLIGASVNEQGDAFEEAADLAERWRVASNKVQELYRKLNALEERAKSAPRSSDKTPSAEASVLDPFGPKLSRREAIAEKVAEKVPLEPAVPGDPGRYPEQNFKYGHSVYQLQRRLNEVLSPSPNLSVDGDYGPKTEAAVKGFQESMGLKPTGFADQATCEALGFVNPVDATPPETPKPNDAAREPPTLRPEVTKWFEQFKTDRSPVKLTDEQIGEVRRRLALDDPATTEPVRLGREIGFAMGFSSAQLNGLPAAARIEAGIRFALLDSIDVRMGPENKSGPPVLPPPPGEPEAAATGVDGPDTRDIGELRGLAPPAQEAAQSETRKSLEPTAAKAPGRIDYSDGKADGKKSLGGSGHLLRFELPEGALGVKAVRIHGSRYGTPEAPNEDFEIVFLSEDRSEILAVEHAPYGLFRRGPEGWTTVKFDKPVLDLPEKFWVAINFSPGRTKGVYVSYDTSTGGERSMTGTAQQPPDRHKPVEFGGDWMVQAVLERE